ncbi:MAG TPA: RNA-binding protein [Chthoniobacterales bacterium]|jgi:RNA recognition motif-containing protein|nr:RNA-binding protein [Chthoniobacterales bacterium]
MASHSSGGRNGRRSRGGPRRRGGGNRPSYQSAPSRAPEKKSFLQWFKDLFSGGGKPAPRPIRQEPARSNGAQFQQERESRPSRKPESVEVTTPRLYVGNLSFDATESDLFELFNGVGAVQNAEVVTYRHNQRSKGFAFVQMLTVDEAKRAVEELHDKEFLGRKLVVSGAKSSDHQPAN